MADIQRNHDRRFGALVIFLSNSPKSRRPSGSIAASILYYVWFGSSGRRRSWAQHPWIEHPWIEHPWINVQSRPGSGSARRRYGFCAGHSVGYFHRKLFVIFAGLASGARFVCPLWAKADINPDGSPHRTRHENRRYDPHKATLLYSVEIPTHCGDTLFASGTVAYDTLDPAMKKKLEGLRAVNYCFYNSVRRDDKQGVMAPAGRCTRLCAPMMKPGARRSTSTG
jgi:hypothetical protein